MKLAIDTTTPSARDPRHFLGLVKLGGEIIARATGKALGQAVFDGSF